MERFSVNSVNPEDILTWNPLDFFLRIKNDDKLIQAEGVESLSEAELREDCRERGMLGVLSVEEMRHQVCMTTKVHYL